MAAGLYLKKPDSIKQPKERIRKPNLKFQVNRERRSEYVLRK